MGVYNDDFDAIDHMDTMGDIFENPVLPRGVMTAHFYSGATHTPLPKDTPKVDSTAEAKPFRFDSAENKSAILKRHMTTAPPESAGLQRFSTELAAQRSGYYPSAFEATKRPSFKIQEPEVRPEGSAKFVGEVFAKLGYGDELRQSLPIKSHHTSGSTYVNDEGERVKFNENNRGALLVGVNRVHESEYFEVNTTVSVGVYHNSYRDITMLAGFGAEGCLKVYDDLKVKICRGAEGGGATGYNKHLGYEGFVLPMGQTYHSLSIMGVSVTKGRVPSGEEIGMDGNIGVDTLTVSYPIFDMKF